MLTSPEDIAAVYKNNVTLSWDAMLNDLLIGFGVRASVIPQLWAKLPIEVTQKTRDGMSNPNPNQISAVHSTLDLYKRQLLPGSKFEAINDTLISYINRFMMRVAVCTMNQRKSIDDLKCVSLSTFCSSVLIGAITRTLFGDGIYKLEPLMTQCLLDFNKDAWMLVFQYPQAANTKMNVARKKILSAFMSYMQGPAHLRSGQAWLIQAVLEEQQHLNVNDEDRAALLLMIYWA